MDIAMDMSFGIVCGVGLFFLLTPFLKKYPLSPPPESQRDIPQGVKRRQRKTRKKISTVKDYRNSRKNAHDTQNASPPMESPTRHHLMDSSSQPFWNCKEILHQLTLSRLFSHLRGLEDLLQHKFIRIVWGISEMTIHTGPGELETSSSQVLLTREPVTQVKLGVVEWTAIHTEALRSTTIHSDTKKVEANSTQELSGQPVTHIKVQRKERAVVTL
nr:spermatogenesis-associated protein 31-like [Rattus norvegicus]